MTDEERLKRRKQTKRKKRGKTVLIVTAVIVLALAAAFTAMKALHAENTLQAILPEKAYHIINEDLLGNTTTTTLPPETSTTAVTTTKPAGHYAPIEDFALEKSKKGNLMGNLLAGGKSWRDGTHIFHIVDGDGIYKFYPPDETYEKIYSSPDYLSNLNVTEKYLYFTNDTDGKLYMLDKEKKTAEPIADDVKTAYVYDTHLYYITKSGILSIMDTAKREPKELYNANGNELSLIGISLKGVYFSTEDSYGTLRFYTVDNEKSEDAVMFREVVNRKDFLAPVMEDGFLYYYTPNEDGTYDLHRQKFGSEQEVTLVEGAAAYQYAIVDLNRLFYIHRDGDRFIAKELNMNTGVKKVMLEAGSVTDDNALIFQHGGTYDFIIGYRNPKSWIYFSSCSSTSSKLVMYFKDGNWKY